MLLCLSLSSCGVKNRAPVVMYGNGKGAGSAGLHTVSEGETLWRISQRYNLPMRDIMDVNQLSPPYMLDVGRRLKLPPPREYKVKAGDTLYKVSRLFSVEMSQVAGLNHLDSPYRVNEGQILRLPSPGRETESSVSKPGHKPEPVSVQTKTAPKPAKKQSQKIAIQHVPKRSSGSGKFMKPVTGNVISSYGPKKDGLHNDGINIKAPRGAPVRAAENGVVVYTGNELEGYGNLVLVRHEGQMMTAYAHLDRVMIKKGQVLKRGESLGTVGSTGSVDTAQLHFEVRKGSKALNPSSYL